MKVPTLAASIMLLSVFFAGADFAHSQPWKKCNGFESNDEEYTRLQHLFRYAQLAERPKHQDNGYMWNCSLPSKQVVAAAPMEVMPLSFTAASVENIRAQFAEQAGDDTFSRAYLDVDKDDDTKLAVGCKGKDGSTRLPINVIIDAYYHITKVGIRRGPSV